MIDESKIKKSAFNNGADIILITLLTMISFPVTLYANSECPQPRKTMTAPEEFLKMKNPLSANSTNRNAGEALYQSKASPIACKTCHGTKGNGISEPGFESSPSSRNFTCAKAIGTIPDGQLFWVIKKGSPGTAMFAFSDLSDNEIWQLIHYIRQFVK